VKLNILLIVFSLISFPLAGRAASLQTPSYTLLLSKDLVIQEPAREFDCRERVYLITTWFKVSGPHRVTAQWFNPEGLLQDEGHLDFTGDPKSTTGWLGLEFLNVADSHLDAEMARFYGRWKVKVLLDNRLLEEQEFFVRCK